MFVLIRQIEGNVFLTNDVTEHELRQNVQYALI